MVTVSGPNASQAATIVRRSSRLSATLSVGAGVVATVAAAWGGPLPAAIAAVGTLLIGAGGLTGYRSATGFGGAVLIAGTLGAGALGAPPGAAVVAVAAALIAWDVADHGADLGERVGQRAGTARNELVHLGGSVGVAAIAVAVGYGSYLVAAGGQPITALVLLVAGGTLLLMALAE